MKTGGGGKVGREIWAHGRLHVVTDARESCRVLGSTNEGSSAVGRAGEFGRREIKEGEGEEVL